MQEIAGRLTESGPVVRDKRGIYIFCNFASHDWKKTFDSWKKERIYTWDTITRNNLYN